VKAAVEGLQCYTVGERTFSHLNDVARSLSGSTGRDRFAAHRKTNRWHGRTVAIEVLKAWRPTTPVTNSDDTNTRTDPRGCSLAGRRCHSPVMARYTVTKTVIIKKLELGL